MFGDVLGGLGAIGGGGDALPSGSTTGDNESKATNIIFGPSKNSNSVLLLITAVAVFYAVRKSK